MGEVRRTTPSPESLLAGYTHLKGYCLYINSKRTVLGRFPRNFSRNTEMTQCVNNVRTKSDTVFNPNIDNTILMQTGNLVNTFTWRRSKAHCLSGKNHEKQCVF